MIVVDDLRPMLPPFGHGYVHAPNLERLAAMSLTFNRTYCNQAVCSPSRNRYETVQLHNVVLSIVFAGDC